MSWKSKLIGIVGILTFIGVGGKGCSMFGDYISTILTIFPGPSTSDPLWTLDTYCDYYGFDVLKECKDAIRRDQEYRMNLPFKNF